MADPPKSLERQRSGSFSVPKPRWCKPGLRCAACCAVSRGGGPSGGPPSVSKVMMCEHVACFFWARAWRDFLERVGHGRYALIYLSLSHLARCGCRL